MRRGETRPSTAHASREAGVQMKRLTTTLRLGAIALGAGLLLAACQAPLADDAEPVRGTTAIFVRDNKFEERVIEVPAGTTVTWTFEGNHQHNVVGDGFVSDVQQNGTFEHEFTTPGRFDYKCTLHGGMTGRVLVVEEGAATGR